MLCWFLWHLTSRCILNNWGMFRSFLVLLVYSRSLPQACNDQNMIHVWVSAVGRSCFLMTTPPVFCCQGTKKQDQNTQDWAAAWQKMWVEGIVWIAVWSLELLKISTKDDAINAIPNADFDPEILFVCLFVCLLGGAFFSRRWGWRLNPTSKAPLWQICHTKKIT